MNIKKIGLTALASSLVATSVYAGELTLSGGAKMSYVKYDGTADSKDIGSGLAMDQEISASGSAELDNGMTVSVSHALTGSGSASNTSVLTLDMGDMGSLSFSDTDMGGGLADLDDMTPSAYEEVWDGIAATRTFAEMATGRGFAYSNTIAGASIGVQYSDNLASSQSTDGAAHGGTGNSSSSSIGVVYPVGDTGLTIYGGVGSEGGVDGKEIDHDTLGAKYAFGPVTVGYQVNDEDDTDASGTDYKTTIVGIAVSVNENLSLSYGNMETDSSANAIDQDIDGVSVAYSMGGMTLSAYRNEASNLANASSSTSEKTELLLTFAF